MFRYKPQLCFDADGGGAVGGGSPSLTTSTDSGQASAPAAETTTYDSPAPQSGGGSTPPATATTGAGDNTVAQSERGSFKLVYNERTGRNEVVSTMPEEPDTSESGQKMAQPQVGTYTGNELVQTAQRLNDVQPVQQVGTQEYTPAELQTAMQLGQVNESRIPVYLRQSYYLAMAGQNTANAGTTGAPSNDNAEQSTQTDVPAANQQEESAEQARQFYQRVQNMARERAMNEVGITQDEIDVAEYTDDETILNKFNAYTAAMENNRAQILRDVENITQQQKAAEADHAKAYQTVAAFVQEMQQKEPNFKAIDALMLTRTQKMPYEEAVKVIPLIEKVRTGNLTTADLPALQEMYNQTRLEYYSNKTGVGLAPQVVKPAYVETPGRGGEAPRQTTPLSQLGKMNQKDKIKAIGQMFSDFLED